MIHAEPALQVLYVSRMAPGCGWEIVKDIVATSRVRNLAHGIGGALLFDGERFGQLIEGPEPAVRALLGNIESDLRHTDVRVILERPATDERLTHRWVSGYCEANELEAFDSASSLREQAALDEFVRLLASADVE